MILRYTPRMLPITKMDRPRSRTFSMDCSTVGQLSGVLDAAVELPLRAGEQFAFWSDAHDCDPDVWTVSGSGSAAGRAVLEDEGVEVSLQLLNRK